MLGKYVLHKGQGVVFFNKLLFKLFKFFGCGIFEKKKFIGKVFKRIDMKFGRFAFDIDLILFLY